MIASSPVGRGSLLYFAYDLVDMVESVRYLTGDQEGIREFIDRFDVSVECYFF